VEFYDEGEGGGDEEVEVDGVRVVKEAEEVGGRDAEGMGPLGTDCDGLGEEGYQLQYANSRRKSLDAAAESQSPPSSPLKCCAFGFEDVDMGCDVWAEAKGKCDVVGEGVEDVQMEEALKGRSLLLRRLEKGDEGERFGDEVDDEADDEIDDEVDDEVDDEAV